MKLQCIVPRVLTAVLVGLGCVSAHGMDISGTARIIDGDTLIIGSQVVRLYGIDAPENGQDCKKQNGKRYDCGAAADNFLNALIKGPVSCVGSEFDAYRRLLARCTSGGIELNRAMVTAGHALAFRRFSDVYIADEESAQAARRGLWEGTFDSPWEFRERQWQAAVEEAPSPDCPIKGNINRKGERIYHTPWSRSYSRTRIDTTRSERWFCTEAEAVEAGWRAPLR